MIVKNIECSNNEFIDVVIDELMKNNINYVLIKNECFTEIHFDKFIYRFFSLKYVDKNNEALSFANSIHNFNLINKTGKEKKIQPGLRKYNKGLIKKDNMKNKIGRR